MVVVPRDASSRPRDTYVVFRLANFALGQICQTGFNFGEGAFLPPKNKLNFNHKNFLLKKLDFYRKNVIEK